MTGQTIIQESQYSFKKYLFHIPRNRVILCLAIVAIIIQFSVFKYFYPFASYIHGDSFSYLNAADRNLTINTYLIGYSKFLRLFSVFAKPDYLLVAFQYLFIQLSMLFLLFTIFYFNRPSKVVEVILLSFMVFNPLFLYLGNLVSSDGFFLALSLSWFALLLWIIYRPSNTTIICHAIVLFIAFTVRYNAMIYPLIAGLAFAVSKLSLRKKISGIGLFLLACVLFTGFTMFQYKKLTGHFQYSPFSGWQIANNAMYAYRYVDSTERKPVPDKLKALDKMVNNYFDTTRDIKKHPTEAAMASTYYMWSPGMPLMKYRNKLYKNDTTVSEFKKWASMGPFYKEYGWYKIKQYPWQYIRYFIWPNASKYYAPPVEFLETYNSGRKRVTSQAKNWFGYKSVNVRTNLKNNEAVALNIYPILSGVINVLMLALLLLYIGTKGWQKHSYANRLFFMGAAVWLINAGFTIFASSAALRFQSFPLMLTTTFVVMLLGWHWEVMTQKVAANELSTVTKKEAQIEVINLETN